MLEWLPLMDYRRLPVVSGVYVIHNKLNGKEYVGSR